MGGRRGFGSWLRSALPNSLTCSLGGQSSSLIIFVQHSSSMSRFLPSTAGTKRALTNRVKNLFSDLVGLPNQGRWQCDPERLRCLEVYAIPFMSVSISCASTLSPRAYCQQDWGRGGPPFWQSASPAPFARVKA